MNDEELKKLFEAAREVKPDTSRAEYGFETRLLSRLRAEHQPSTPWPAVVWKLMPVFATIVVALGVWTAIEPGANSSDLRSALTGDHDDKTLVSYLTGESQ
jgi:hypothetical protein